MKKRQTEHEFTERQERVLLRAASAAVKMGLLAAESPRCPEPSVIRNLANRRIPAREAGDLVDHIATCASCFKAYNRYRRRRRTAKLGTPLIAAVLCSVGLALMLSHRAPQVSFPKRAPANAPTGTTLTATLDYRENSPTRSAEGRNAASGASKLSKAKFNLTILLPFGTEDGPYSVQLRSQAGDPVIETTGTATWNGNAEALTTSIDLRPLPSGEYTLALRRNGASWHTYRLTLGESE